MKASTRWEWIGGPAAKLVATDTLYALAPGNSSINKFDPASKTWTNIGGAAADFAVGYAGVFAFTPDKSAIWLRNSSGVWSRVGDSGFSRFVSSGSSGGAVYAVVSTNRGIRRYDGPFNWTSVGGDGADWAVTSRGLLFGLSPTKSGVFARLANGTWQQVGGPAEAIYGGHPDIFALSPGDKQIMRIPVSSTGSMGAWVRVGGPATTVILSHRTDGTGRIWSVSPWDNNIVSWN